MRRVLGSATLFDVLSDRRVGIMADIRASVNEAASRLGIELVEVRVRRADFPEAVRETTYNRMKSEREREARSSAPRASSRPRRSGPMPTSSG